MDLDRRIGGTRAALVGRDIATSGFTLHRNLFHVSSEQTASPWIGKVRDDHYLTCISTKVVLCGKAYRYCSFGFIVLRTSLIWPPQDPSKPTEALCANTIPIRQADKRTVATLVLAAQIWPIPSKYKIDPQSSFYRQR